METIFELQEGETAIISSLGKIEKTFRHRMMDLGISEGADVTMVRRLKLNNLLLVEVDEVELCIRKKDAKLIEIQRGTN